MEMTKLAQHVFSKTMFYICMLIAFMVDIDFAHVLQRAERPRPHTHMFPYCVSTCFNISIYFALVLQRLGRL